MGLGEGLVGAAEPEAPALSEGPAAPLRQPAVAMGDCWPPPPPPNLLLFQKKEEICIFM